MSPVVVAVVVALEPAALVAEAPDEADVDPGVVVFASLPHAARIAAAAVAEPPMTMERRESKWRDLSPPDDWSGIVCLLPQLAPKAMVSDKVTQSSHE